MADLRSAAADARVALARVRAGWDVLAANAEWPEKTSFEATHIRPIEQMTDRLAASADRAAAEIEAVKRELG